MRVEARIKASQTRWRGSCRHHAQDAEGGEDAICVRSRKIRIFYFQKITENDEYFYNHSYTYTYTYTYAYAYTYAYTYAYLYSYSFAFNGEAPQMRICQSIIMSVPFRIFFFSIVVYVLCWLSWVASWYWIVCEFFFSWDRLFMSWDLCETSLFVGSITRYFTSNHGSSDYFLGLWFFTCMYLTYRYVYTS